MSYYDFIQQHIFAPAGMTASGWFERGIPPSGVASGYTKMTDHDDSPAWLDNIYTAPARGALQLRPALCRERGPSDRTMDRSRLTFKGPVIQRVTPVSGT